MRTAAAVCSKAGPRTPTSVPFVLHYPSTWSRSLRPLGLSSCLGLRDSVIVCGRGQGGMLERQGVLR